MFINKLGMYTWYLMQYKMVCRVEGDLALRISFLIRCRKTFQNNYKGLKKRSASVLFQFSL